MSGEERVPALKHAFKGIFTCEICGSPKADHAHWLAYDVPVLATAEDWPCMKHGPGVRCQHDECKPRAASASVVEKAVAQGRYVYVTTYHDGTTPIEARLLFKRPEEASRCADVLRSASAPLSVDEALREYMAAEEEYSEDEAAGVSIARLRLARATLRERLALRGNAIEGNKK